jgi:hypothetical protein
LPTSPASSPMPSGQTRPQIQASPQPVQPVALRPVGKVQPVAAVTPVAPVTQR